MFVRFEEIFPTFNEAKLIYIYIYIKESRKRNLGGKIGIFIREEIGSLDCVRPLDFPSPFYRSFPFLSYPVPSPSSSMIFDADPSRSLREFPLSLSLSRVWYRFLPGSG